MQLTLAKNSEMAIEKKHVTPGIKSHNKCNMLVKKSLKLAQPVDNIMKDLGVQMLKIIDFVETA